MISDLRAPHKQILTELAKLAIKSLKDDTIVFKKEEITSVCPSLTEHEQNWSGLGLLKAVSFFSFEQTTREVSYNFLHFSIQEFLAAYHVTLQHEGEQIALLDKFFWEGNFLNMWVMYVGLTKGKSFSFAHFLSGNYFVWQSKLRGAMGISSSIIQNKVKRLQLFQCFSEAENDVMCRQVGELLKGGKIDLSGQALLRSNLLTLSLFLARSTTKIWTTVNLSKCSIGDDGIKNLYKSFCNDCKSNTVIKRLDLSYNGISYISVTELAKLLLTWNINTLNISGNKLQENILALAKSLQDNCDSGKIVHLEVAQHYIMIACLAKYSKIREELVIRSFTGLYLLKCNFNEDIFGAIKWLNSFSRTKKPHIILYLCDNALPFPLITNSLVVTIHPYSHCKLFLQDYGVSVEMIAAAFKKLTVSCNLAVQFGDNPLPLHICNVNNEKDNKFYESLIPQCSNGTVCFKGFLSSAWITQWVSKLHSNQRFKCFYLNGYCNTNDFADHLSTAISYSNAFSCLRLNMCDLKEAELSSIFLALKEKSSTLKHIELSEIALVGVDGNKAVAELASLISVSPLEYISLSRCMLAENDLSVICTSMEKCENLTYLDLSHNYISEVAAKAIATYLIGNKCNLQHLYLSNCFLTEEGIAVLAQSFQKLKRLRTLEFSSNIITANGAASIISILDSNSNIRNVLFYNCELCGSNVKTILSELVTKENLTQLDLSCNIISHDDGIIVTGIITSNPLLEYLDFSGCDLSPPAMIKITEMLARNSNIKFLSLSGHKFTEVLSTNIAMLVHQNINLEYLNLSRCDIKGITCYKCLENLKSLRFIDFSFNVLSDEAAVTIANAISSNVTLNCIRLSNCALTDFGLMKVTNAINNQSYLTNIDLSNNNVYDNVAFELAAAILKNDYLETLCISNCSLQQKGFRAIVKALQQTRMLKSIDVSSNTIANKIGNIIIKFLSINTTLQYANISNCQLDEEVLEGALSNITSLKYLNLGGCKLNEDVLAIKRIIEQNVFLEHLVLSKCSIEVLYLISMLMVQPKAMKHIDFSSNVSSRPPGTAADIDHEQYRLTKIEYLDFSKCNLRKADISAICKTISNTTTLRHLNLSGNIDISNEAVTILVKSISSNVHLEQFNICDCDIQNNNLKVILEAFRYHVFLKSLDLRSSHVTDDVAVCITTIIANNFALKHLKLSHISLKKLGFKVLSKHLEKITCLQQLCVNDVDIFDCEAKIIANCISHSNLNHFDLSECSILEAGINSILDALVNVKSLENFNLSDNIISESSADMLCNTVANNTELTHIEIARCELQDNYFQKFANILPSGVKNLDISGNTISENTAQKLAGRLIKMFEISRFIISKCSLPDKGAQFIFDSLQSFNSLIHLDISNNVITNQTSYLLAKTLCNNTALQFLNISDCKLTDIGSYNVIEALKHMTNLNHINLSNNEIGFQSTIALAEVFMSNSQLNCVLLEGTDLTEDGIVSVCKGLKDKMELSRLGLSCRKISFQIAEVLASLLIDNKKMVYFGLPFTELSGTVVAKVFDSVANNLGSLETLNLSLCTITDDLANHLAATIASNKLKQLNFSEVCLSQNGFDIMQQNFSMIFGLSSITFNNVNLTISNVRSLTSALTNNSNLKYFSLENCVVAVDVVDMITMSLKNVRTLRYLNVNFVPMSDGNEIAAVIANNTSLEQLELAGCNISDVVFVKVIETIALKSNQLRCLNLSCNNISYHVSMHLGKFLKCSMITKLMISNTQLEEDGLTAICRSMQNVPIQCIDFSNNKISYKSACSIADMITSNSSLEQLDLSACVLEETSATKIASAFKGLTSLKHLNIKFDANNTAHEIASVILNNRKLELLNLASCNFQEKGLLTVLNASSKISTLRYLSLNLTCVLASVIKAIIDVICCSSNLEHLELYGNIPENDITNIIKKLQEKSSLRFLKITSNGSITSKIAREIANFLCANCAIEHLLIPHFVLQQDGIKEITTALRNLENCKVIDFSSSSITDSIVVQSISSLFCRSENLKYFHTKTLFLFQTEFNKLSNYLNKFSSLEFLYIERCEISTAATVILANALSLNTNLKGLSLAYCEMPETELKIIFKSLNNLVYLNKNNVNIKNLIEEFAAVLSRSSATLTHLEIAGCAESDTGTLLFGLLSAKLKCLKHVNFSYNTITSLGTGHIINICNSNNNIERFELCHCSVNETELSAIVGSLKELKKLKYLDLNFNHITPDIAIKLVHLVSLGNLEALNLANIQADMVKITFALAKIMSLMHLDLSYSSFNDEAALNLANFVTNNTLLQELKLCDCQFSATGLQHIVSVLKKHHVNCLHISFPVMNVKGYNVLSHLLCEHILWEILVLSALKRINFHVSDILNSIKHNCNFKQFDISSDSFHDGADHLIVSIVNKNSDILVVNLSSCFLNLENSNIIVSRLKCFTSLRHIDLSSNHLDEQSIGDLGELLYISVNLEHLNLSNCKLNASRLLKIAQKLKYKTSLHYLDISSNDIHFQVALDVLNIISSNFAIMLSHLNISNCRLHYREDKGFTDSLHINTLSYLDCSDNEMFSLAVLTLADILATNNNIRHLNMSNLEMQDANDFVKLLSALRMSDSHNLPLKYLNLGGNTLNEEAIRNLAAVVSSNQISLKHLILKNCQIFRETRIIFKALTSVTSLESLNLSNIAITNQVEDNLAITITENTNLHSLDLCHCNLSQEFLTNKLSMVCNIQLSLNHLNISKSYISSAACAKLANSLHTITHLDLSRSLKDPAKFSENLKSLGNLSTLNYLNLSVNDSGSCLEGLGQLVSSNIALRHLDLSRCKMEHTGIKILFDILSAQNSLKYLDLSENDISVQHPNAPVSTIENCVLEHLNLSSCNLCEGEIEAVCGALAGCSHLGYINLSSSQLLSEGQQAAAVCVASLIEHSKLYSVHLSNCCLKESGLKKIFLAIDNFNAKLLSEIDISCQPLSEEVTKHLALMITHTHSLTYLNLANCGLNEHSGVTRILNALENAQSIKLLDFSCNGFPQVSTSILRDCIASQQWLCHLNLSNCKLSSCVVLQVLDAVMDKTSLCHLNIGGNMIDDTAADKLATLISINRSLKELMIVSCEMKEDSTIAVVTSVLKVANLQVVDISFNPIEHKVDQLSELVACHKHMVLKRNQSLFQIIAKRNFV